MSALFRRTQILGYTRETCKICYICILVVYDYVKIYPNIGSLKQEPLNDFVDQECWQGTAG